MLDIAEGKTGTSAEQKMHMTPLCLQHRETNSPSPRGNLKVRSEEKQRKKLCMGKMGLIQLNAELDYVHFRDLDQEPSAPDTFNLKGKKKKPN